MIVTVAWVAFAAGLALWVGVFISLLRITRPRQPEPGLSTPEPGPERPAIAGLLTTRGRIGGERAAAATLVDLAARGHLRLTQDAGDPRLTEVTIQTGPHEWAELAPYELRVLSRISDRASHDVAPLSRLPFRSRRRARSWGVGMAREVVRAARDAGLVWRRFEPVHRTILFAVSGVPAAALGLAALVTADKYAGQTALGAVVAVLVGLNALLGLPLGVRETAAGREAATRALAFRAWLREHPSSFTEPPQAGITTWGGNEAYRVAFGLIPYAAEFIDFGARRRGLIWSPVTGAWRQVRVRYPDNTVRHGATVRSALSEITSDLGLGVVLLCFPGSVVLWVPMMAVAQSAPPLLPWYLFLIGATLVFVAVRWVVRSVYCLQGLIAERDTLVTVRGRVLRVDHWKGGKPDDREARHHLVVDDGSSDELTAWCMTGPALCATGDTVQFTALPFSRRVLAITRRTRPDQGDHGVR